jgi:endo-1,4-beta-D-glucanase Y
VKQGGRSGWWWVFADPLTTGAQTPAANSIGPIAAAAVPADDSPGTCNQWALHSTATGHTQYVGVGATFVPGSGTGKSPYDVSSYSGISFSIKAGTSGQGPVYFEIPTEETQSSMYGGTATDSAVALNNNRGMLLTGIGTTWQTVYIPFSNLIPRWLPSPSGGNPCAAGAKCQAPTFVEPHTLAFQFSVYPDADFPASNGSYDLWLDNVAFYTGDNGLAPGSTTLPTFHDGTFSACSKPSGTAGKYLFSAYSTWKSRFVTTTSTSGELRVQRPENSNDSVSEGIAYGMLLAVYFNDQTLFNGLWKYWSDRVVSGTMLMDWEYGANDGTGDNGKGSASDADEDTAFALLMANKKWGGNNYSGNASTLIGNIFTKDVDSGTGGSLLVKGGSNYGAPSPTNPSYFAPAYYRLFASVDTGHNWSGVVDAVYAALDNISAAVSDGLVPAWCGDSAGKHCNAVSSNGAATDGIYQYDAHRVPWRIGLDYCWNGASASHASEATAYLSKTSSFFSGIVTASSAGGIARIVDMYNTNGTAYSGGQPNSMSIVGAAAVGAMSSTSYSTFVQSAYQLVLDGVNRGTIDYKAGVQSGYSYYNATVGLLTLLTMSGNFYALP